MGMLSAILSLDPNIKAYDTIANDVAHGDCMGTVFHTKAASGEFSLPQINPYRPGHGKSLKHHTAFLDRSRSPTAGSSCCQTCMAKVVTAHPYPYAGRLGPKGHRLTPNSVHQWGEKPGAIMIR